MAEKTITTSSPSVTSALFGTFDANINAIENAFKVKILNRPLNNDLGDCITISGDENNVNNAVQNYACDNTNIICQNICQENT